MSLSQQQTFACFPVKAKQLCKCRPRNSTGRLETRSLREDNAVFFSLSLTLCSSALIQSFCFSSKNTKQNQKTTNKDNKKIRQGNQASATTQTHTKGGCQSCQVNSRLYAQSCSTVHWGVYYGLFCVMKQTGKKGQM